jgi:hypothetical protein
VYTQLLRVVGALASRTTQQQPHADDQLVQVNRRGDAVAAPRGQCPDEAPVRWVAAEEQVRHLRTASAGQVGQDLIAQAIGQHQVQQQDVWEGMPVAQPIERFPPGGCAQHAEPLARQGLTHLVAPARVAVDHENTC